MNWFNKKLFLILFTIFSIIYISTIIYNNERVEKQLNYELHNNLKKAKNNLKSSLYHYKLLSENIYDSISHHTKVIELLKKAAKTSDENQKNIYRKELYSQIKFAYKRVLNIGAFQFHFVLPDKKSFLRMHRVEKYGDDISNVRETYNYVFKEKKPISAFENGKVLHAYRFVYPLFDTKGDIISAFEISFLSVNIQKNLREFSNMHNHFLVKKSIFEKHQYSIKSNSGNYIQSIEHEDYLFNPNKLSNAHDQIKLYEQKLIKPHKELIKEKMDKGEEFSFYTKSDNKINSMIFLPIKNLKGVLSAYIVVFQEDKFGTELFNNNKSLNIIIFISLAGFFITLYYFVESKNILQKEVKKQTKQLRDSAKIISKFIIYTKTDSQGYITEASEAFCKISGYTKEELIGKHHRIVRDPSYKNHPTIQKMSEALKKEEIWNGEFKNITKDGKTYWLKSTISPEYENKKLIGYIAFREDISDKKALEDLNKNLESIIAEKVKENLKQREIILVQEKKAALGNMMDAIAHQWKQPLSIISMYVTNVCVKHEFGETLTRSDFKELEQEVSSQIDHLVNTIDEFRRFFRPNQKTKRVNLGELIDSTLALMKDTIINNNIEIDIKGDKNIQIECIPAEFKHVFINLINNAKDAFVENNIENRLINLVMQKDEKKIYIKVCDNAGGIPKDIIGKIFGSNFTTKEEGKGTGIGLFLVKQIIEKLVGTIEAKNTDNGACFIITLQSRS